MGVAVDIMQESYQTNGTNRGQNGGSTGFEALSRAPVNRL